MAPRCGHWVVLKKARQEDSAAPVVVRLLCNQFVERSWKLSKKKTDEVLRQARQDRAKFEQELREGEERLE